MHRQNSAASGRPCTSRKGPSILTADAILSTFNTWSFKREQPDSRDSLSATVASCIERGDPVQFVLYWGRGKRDDLANADIQCLDYINKLHKRIAEVYPPGAHIVLILTDTHAALNGFDETDTDRYFAAVTEEAQKRSFRTMRLSELVEHCVVTHAKPELSIVPMDLLTSLIASASKWYRGGSDPRTGAIMYYNQNMVEKKAVEAAYPSAIFVTFNGSDQRPLFPDNMPIFFMYSMRRGVSVKPWFFE